MLFVEKTFLWLMIYSFIGWVYESTLCSITSGSLVNRGFLNGPICPVYGFGALIVIFALQSETGNLLSLFLSSVLLTGVLEYFTSWVLEKLFHAKWWDYSNYRFNLNGRVCLLGAVVFGTLSVILMKWLHPAVSAFVDSFSPTVLLWTAAGIFVVAASDCFVTVRHILSLNGRLAEIQSALDQYRTQAKKRAEDLGAALQQRLEESLAASPLEGMRERLEESRPVVSLGSFRERLEERFENSELNSRRVQSLLEMKKFQDKRLLRAFPRMSSTRYGEAMEKLRERLNLHKEK